MREDAGERGWGPEGKSRGEKKCPFFLRQKKRYGRSGVNRKLSLRIAESRKRGHDSRSRERGKGPYGGRHQISKKKSFEVPGQGSYNPQEGEPPLRKGPSS